MTPIKAIDQITGGKSLHYPRLLSEEILLITASGYDRMMKQYESARYFGDDYNPDDDVEVVDGVAIIEIGGPIGHNLDGWDKLFGAVDVKDVSAQIDEAADSSEVRAILFNIDSPGGMVTGTPELAEKIMGLEKPTLGFSEGMMASAAYWIGCACDQVIATKSADIGSIGVYIPFYDVSEMLKSFGVKVELFTSGKYKGLGFPGTQLTKDHSKLLQARVMETAEMFWDHVRSMRGDVSSSAMQGQTFRALGAQRENLIDDIVSDLSEAIEMISAK